MTINDQFSVVLGFPITDLKEALNELDKEGKFNQKVILDLLSVFASRMQDQEKEIEKLQKKLK